MSSSFNNWHPISQILYYLSVITITVTYMHPVIILITLFSMFSLGIMIESLGFLKTIFKFYVPFILLGIIINPLFSHEGMTTLAFFPDGNPLTLESIIFGICSGLMIGSVCISFFSFNKVMTSDRIIFLVGRLFPHISLIISMALRFIPEYKHHYNEIKRVKKSLGYNGKPLKYAFLTLSAMVTWAFENSIERSDSMRDRGYGSVLRRTNYNLYTFSLNDGIRITVTLLCTAGIITMFYNGWVRITYYPYFEMSGYVGVLAIMYMVLAVMPVVDLLIKEIKWKYLISRI